MNFGEFELIRHIRERRKADPEDVLVGIGDDAAAVLPSPGMAALATTDTFVEGLDFDIDFSTWHQIGWKGMTANISDIAAMGGLPKYALTTLCLPEQRSIEEVEALYAGMDQLIAQIEQPVSIIGGDLSGIDGPTVLSITLMGEVEPEHMLTRTGARPGDLIGVTGHLGASEAGLRILQYVREHPEAQSLLDQHADVVTRHRTPVPRTREARLLAACGAVTAMIDISDGLSSDVLHIGRSSRVGLSIDTTGLPISAGTRAAAQTLNTNPVELAMQSGEEFELLCTIRPDHADRIADLLVEQTGIPLTIIGEVTDASDGFSRHDESGRHPLQPGGYEHFR